MENKLKGHGYIRKTKLGVLSGIALGVATLSVGTSVSADEVTPPTTGTETTALTQGQTQPDVQPPTSQTGGETQPEVNTETTPQTNTETQPQAEEGISIVVDEVVDNVDRKPVTSPDLDKSLEEAKEQGVVVTEKEPVTYETEEQAKKDLTSQKEKVDEVTAKAKANNEAIAAAQAKNKEIEAANKAEIERVEKENAAEKERVDTENAKRKAAYDSAKAQYDKEKAVYDVAKADYDKAKVSYDQAKAKYDQDKAAYDKAKAQYDVDKPAYDKAKAAYDQAKAKYDQDKAAYDQAKAKYDKDKSSYDSAKAQYDKDKAAYDQAKAQYDKQMADYNKAVASNSATNKELEGLSNKGKALNEGVTAAQKQYGSDVKVTEKKIDYSNPSNAQKELDTVTAQNAAAIEAYKKAKAAQAQNNQDAANSANSVGKVIAEDPNGLKVTGSFPKVEYPARAQGMDFYKDITVNYTGKDSSAKLLKDSIGWSDSTTVDGGNTGTNGDKSGIRVTSPSKGQYFVVKNVGQTTDGKNVNAKVTIADLEATAQGSNPPFVSLTGKDGAWHFVYGNLHYLVVDIDFQDDSGQPLNLINSFVVGGVNNKQSSFTRFKGNQMNMVNPDGSGLVDAGKFGLYAGNSESDEGLWGAPRGTYLASGVASSLQYGHYGKVAPHNDSYGSVGLTPGDQIYFDLFGSVASVKTVIKEPDNKQINLNLSTVTLPTMLGVPTPPQEPKAPVAPTAPTEPKAPVAPTAPTEPKAPVAPTEPKAPVEPTAPTEPLQPELLLFKPQEPKLQDLVEVPKKETFEVEVHPVFLAVPKPEECPPTPSVTPASNPVPTFVPKREASAPTLPETGTEASALTALGVLVGTLGLTGVAKRKED